MATVVVDANVIVQVSIDAAGLGPLAGHDLVAPPVMRSEALSSLHEMRYRGEISAELARAAMTRLGAGVFEVRSPPELAAAAWSVAEELGWAKTYDAEYVALARLLDCALVTLDGRLIRGAASVARIVSPDAI